MNLAKSKHYDGRYIVSYYALRDKSTHAAMMDDSFAVDLYAFRNAIRFLNGNLDIAVFPVNFVDKAATLKTLGSSAPMGGIGGRPMLCVRYQSR